MTSTIYTQVGQDRQRELFAAAEEYRQARQARGGTRRQRRWSQQS